MEDGTENQYIPTNPTEQLRNNLLLLYGTTLVIDRSLMAKAETPPEEQDDLATNIFREIQISEGALKNVKMLLEILRDSKQPPLAETSIEAYADAVSVAIERMNELTRQYSEQMREETEGLVGLLRTMIAIVNNYIQAQRKEILENA